VITRSWSAPLVGALAPALALALAPAADAKPGRAVTPDAARGAAPRGRMVRVERDVAAAVPRICLMGAGGDSHVCLGQPRPGERIAVFSPSEPRMRGELVIDTVTDATALSSGGLCISGGAATVKGWYAAGSAGDDNVTGLRGARVNPDISRVLSGVKAPSGRDDERVDLAVDADGNGSADLVVTAYSCTAEGAPAQGAGPDAPRCLDTYTIQRGKLRRAHQDIVRSCR
jgi:hypothetical protein